MRFDSIKQKNTFKSSVNKLKDKYTANVTLETSKNIAPMPKNNVTPIVETEKPKTSIGKILATPVAFLAQLGTGTAQGLEGAVDFGTSAGVTGINTARDRRIQAIDKEIEKLKAKGKGDSDIVKALERSKAEAQSAVEYSNKTAEDFVGKQWVQDNVGKSVDEFTNDYSYLPTKAGEVTKTVGNMLPSIANAGSIAKSLPQATSKIGQIATKGATMLPFMAQAAGSSTEQALNEGANLADATKYGLASGAIEGAIESISGGIGGNIGGKLVSSKLGKEAIERITKNALGKYALKLADAGVDVLGEGFEEVLSTAINPLIQRMTYDEQAELATSEEMMQSFIDGVLASLLVKGGQAGLSRVTNRNNVNAQENEAQNQAQTQNVEPSNVTLPNQVETAQNVNMEQITQMPNLPTQKAQETLQSAKIAGMTDMDIQKAKELNDMLRSGTRLNFYDEKTIPQNVQADKAKIANGFYKDGTLWINKNSKNKVEQILGHELTHHLETTDSYTDLSNTILDSEVFYDFVAEKGYTNVAEYKNKLKEMGYNDAQLDNELVARFVEEKMFTDQKSIDRLARQNTKLVEKIKNWISDLVVSFKGTAQEKELRRIENMYRKALEQARNTPASAETQYSIAGVKAMENINDAELTNAYNEAQRTGQNTRGWFKDKEGNWKFEFSDKDMTLKKNVRLSDKGNRLGDILEHDILFRAYPELRNTIVNFKEFKSGSGFFHKGTGEITLNKKLFNTQDWKKSVEASLLHEVQHAIQEIEGFSGAANPFWSKKAYYETLGEIEAADTKERFLKERAGTLDRNVTKPRSSEANPKHPRYDKYMQSRGIVDKAKDAIFPYYAGKGVRGYEVSEENTLENNKSDLRENDNGGLRRYVNETAGKEPAFSMPETDNQGRTLSKEQQEFFKDSKVRDENGNLLEVYHGTPSGGFTIFDANKLSRDTKTTQYGKGFYFTDKQNLAKAYSEGENSQLYSVYLDIKNPFTISWLDDKSHNLDRDGLKNILLEGNNKEFYDKWIADSQSNIEKLGNLTKDNILKMSKEEKVELFLKGEYDRFNDQHVLRELVRAFNTNGELIDSMQRNLGYDGIIVEDKLRGNQYIAFNSNQIKNVDNTNPTSNPDIRYSMNPVEVAKNTSKSQESSLLNEIAPIDDKKLEAVEEKETTASILTKSPKRPAKDLLKQSVDVAMRKLVDAGNTINTVGKLTGDKHLYEYFNNAKQARQSAEYMIGEAQTDIKGNRVGNSLIRIFEEVRSKGDAYTNEFFEYLLHMHNIDRMAQNKPVFGESVKAEDSRRIANQLLEKHPEFEKQANKVYAYNRNLMQWRVDSGLISKEQADLMNEMYPHYVPTFRDVSGTSGSRAMQNTVQIANTVRKATGSNKDIMPIDASMARQTMQTVQAAKRNLLGNRLLNDALNNKDKVGEYIQAVEKTTEQNDLETELDTPKDTNLDSNNNVFKIFRNGETYVMQVNNGIYEGLKSISSEIDNTDTKLLLKPVKAANTAFKQLITGYSPMFTIRNFARDIQDAGLYSKNLRSFLKKYPKAYQEMMGNGKMWQLYKSLGGTGSSFFDYETGIEKTLDTQNKTSTKIKDATLGKVEELNMMIEQAPRFAEFMATIEKAGNQNYDTLMEAMLNAADITVNFGRSGTVVKEWNSTFVPFLNPSIQGFDKLTRTVLESKDGKKFAKLAIRATLLGILPTVINELLYWDDEEYENLTDRDKDTNFLIKTGDNKWLKIPKGRVLSIFGNTAARGLRTLKGEKWDAGEYLKNQASQTAPISVLESNIASPIQAVKNNKTWYGSDIVPQRLQDYAPKDQYDENTDVFSKWLGSKINYSPKKINYLIDAYTGIIGDVVLPLTTPKAETNPFTKAFVVDGVTSNEISNDFYNMLDKYNPKQNPKKSAKEVSRYLNKQSSQVSDIYKQIREVENSDISDDEKRKQVRELRELANTIELTAMATVPEYEKAVDKYRGTFADEDVDSDYAYLFANKDVFGAEYAVKTFSKSLYNNHKDENMNTFFRNYFTREYFQKKIEPTKTTKTTKNTLPTLKQQRATLPTLKK